jgi:hypothetical protein
MTSRASRFGIVTCVLVLAFLPARAADGTSVAAFRMSPDEQACVMRAVDKVANAMGRDDPSFGRMIRVFFTRVPRGEERPVGQVEFYRELQLIERLGVDRKIRESGVTVEWIVEDVVRQNFPRDGLY